MHNAFRLCAHMLSACGGRQVGSSSSSSDRALAWATWPASCYVTPKLVLCVLLQSVFLFPGLCRLSFKGKTCCRYTILPKSSASSLWRMQSAASNLSNCKTPLILQPRAAKYFECPSSALQNSTFRSSRPVSLETPHQSAAGPIKQCSTHMHLDPAL